jgi:hypothetical protein
MFSNLSHAADFQLKIMGLAQFYEKNFKFIFRIYQFL